MKSIYPTSKQQGGCITHHPTNRQIGIEKRARSSEGAPCLTCFLRAASVPPVGALPSCPPLPPPQWSGPAPPAASGCRPAPRPEGPPLQTAPPQKHEYAGDRTPQHHRSSIQDPRGFLTATVVAVLKQPLAWSLTTEQLEVQSESVMTTHPRPSAGPAHAPSPTFLQNTAKSCCRECANCSSTFSSLQQLPLSVLTCTRCSRPCSSRGPPSSSAAKSRSRGGWPAGVMPPSRGAGCTSPLSQSCRA